MTKFKMKKITIPLTLAMLLSPALVNATTFNIYGLAHLSADNVDDGQTSSSYVASNSSRLGVSGDYALSNNLTVIFQYETGVDLTAQGTNDGNGGADSSGQIFTKGRPSFLGLSGRMGKILIGHMPALDQWANDYNLFADQVGDLGDFWEASGVPGRLDNVIYYSTPTFNHFDVAITYKPEEGVNNSDHYIVKGNYDNNGLKVGVSIASIGQASMSNNDHIASALTVGYTFGRFSLGGGFQQEYDIKGISGNDRNSFTLGGTVNIGEKGKIKVQFANTSGEYDKSDATLISVGYDFLLADNTTLYIAYANVNNEENVNFSVNGKGHGDKVTPALGDDPHAFSLGIVYNFDMNLLK